MTEEHYETLFNIRPSLRVLIHGRRNITHKKLACYVRNILTNQVIKRNSEYPGSMYYLPLPKIGDFTINWLGY